MKEECKLLFKLVSRKVTSNRYPGRHSSRQLNKQFTQFPPPTSFFHPIPPLPVTHPPTPLRRTAPQTRSQTSPTFSRTPLLSPLTRTLFSLTTGSHAGHPTMPLPPVAMPTATPAEFIAVQSARRRPRHRPSSPP